MYQVLSGPIFCVHFLQFLQFLVCIDYSQNNVCFIKIRSKHSSNTLLSLLRIFMKQTLVDARLPLS